MVVTEACLKALFPVSGQRRHTCTESVNHRTTFYTKTKPETVTFLPGPQCVQLLVADRRARSSRTSGRRSIHAGGSSLIQPCACAQRRNDPTAARRHASALTTTCCGDATKASGAVSG